MIQQGATEGWGVGQVVLPPSAQWNVFLFLRCRVNRLELSLPSHSADPPPVHLHHASVFLLWWSSSSLCSCICSTHLCVCGCAKLFFFKNECVLMCHIAGCCCCVGTCGHINLQGLHLCVNQCTPLDCGTLLCVVLFHGSLRWFVPYLLPTHCASCVL